MSEEGNSYDASAAARAFEAGLGVSSEAIEAAQPHAVATVGIGGGGDPRLSPEKAETQEVKESRPVERLAEHVRNVFRLNASYRRENGVDDRLEQARLLSSRKYGEKERQAIAAAIGTEAKPLYFGWVESKRHAMASTLGEINSGSGEKPWTLAVTPSPEVPEMVKANALELSMEKIRELQRMVAALAGAKGLPPEKVKEIMPSPALMAKIAPQMLDEAKRIEKEHADEACARMETLIWDQMVEGGFNDAFADMVEYLTIYGVAVMVGPVPRTRRKLVRRKGTNAKMVLSDEMVLEFEAVPPIDCYPSPGARTAEDGELIIRRRFSPSDLAAFARAKEKEAKGWRRDAVDAILTAFPNGGVREKDEHTDWSSYDYEKEAGQIESRSCQIEGLEYFGQVRGSELLGAGLTKDANGKAVKAEDYYEVDCLTIMDLVVFCRIVEPEVGRPISKFEFYRTPESWWSEGIMDRCADAQRMSNGFIRSMAVNAAQSSGPQIVVDQSRLADGKRFVARPWAVNYIVPPPMGTQPSGSPPVQFINVPSNMTDLMQGYSFCKTQGDELSELPAFTYGNTAGASSGITRTASVLSMLTEGATRGAKHSVRQIDEGTRSMVLRCYHWNMLHHPNESVKVGDITCNPSGVMGYLYVENNYNKVLQYMQLTGNPTDMQIIGAKGRAYLLREIAKLMQLNPDKIVPTVEALEVIEATNKAKEAAALAQQEANVEATEAGTEGVDRRNAMGGEPSAPVAQAPEEETAETPGVGQGVNNQRAQQAAARRMVRGEERPGQLTPQQKGIIAATTGNPRARAAAGARSAAARRGGG